MTISFFAWFNCSLYLSYYVNYSYASPSYTILFYYVRILSYPILTFSFSISFTSIYPIRTESIYNMLLWGFSSGDMIMLDSTRFFFFWEYVKGRVEQFRWGVDGEEPGEEDSAGEKVRWIDGMDEMCKCIRGERAYQHLYQCNRGNLLCDLSE